MMKGEEERTLRDATENELWQELWQRIGHDGLVKVAKSIIEEDDAQRKIDDFFSRHAGQAEFRPKTPAEIAMKRFQEKKDLLRKG